MYIYVLICHHITPQYFLHDQFDDGSCALVGAKHKEFLGPTNNMANEYIKYVCITMYVYVRIHHKHTSCGYSRPLPKVDSRNRKNTLQNSSIPLQKFVLSL